MITLEGGKQKAEHILVMEKHLGRKLKRNEIVHHVDETFEGRSNNDFSNLRLVTRASHCSHHHKGKGKGYCVYFDSWKGKWRLEIGNKRIGLVKRDLGVFETKEKALEFACTKYDLLKGGMNGSNRQKV